MAVPTLSTVTPDETAPASEEMVKLEGTGYNIPSIPVPEAQYPGVRVWFDDRESENVKPVTSSVIYVQVPRYLGKAKDLPASVDVRIANLDANGDIVIGEDITFPGVFTYRVESLRAPEEREFWILAVRELIHEFERQTGLLVHFGTHVDWREEGTLDYFEAVPPVLGILDMDVRDFPYRDKHGRVEVLESPDNWTLHRDTEQAEFNFTMILVCNNKDELMRYYDLVRKLGQRTKYLLVPRTESTPEDRVQVKIRLDLDADISLNFRQVLASATFSVLVGPCPVESVEALDRAWKADVLVYDLRNSL